MNWPRDDATRLIAPDIPPGLLASAPDLFYHCCRAVMGRLTTVPLDMTAPWQILELVCRTGSWGREVARRYPMTQVVGIDRVIPAVPSPCNWAFLQGDMVFALDAASGEHGASIHFVHPPGGWHERFQFIRLTNLGRLVPTDAWDSLLLLLTAWLAPRGWIELVNLGLVETEDGSPLPSAIALMNQNELAHLYHRRNVNLTFLPELGVFLETWRRVASERYALPIGPRGGRLGALMKAWYHHHVTDLGQQLLADGMALADLRFDTKMAVRSFVQQPFCLPVYVTRGQKP